MRTVDEAVSDIKSILNNIERTEECYGETLVDIDELCDEILTISCRPQKTNADRIRVMSDEELAEFFFGRFAKWNEECDKDKLADFMFTRKERFLQWLKQKVKE